MVNTTNFLDLSPFIEHTSLKPDVAWQDIKTLCEEAIKYKFRGVCVNSQYLTTAREFLAGSPILIVTVVGFPLGACHYEVKRKEAILSEELGAHELDMVINIGAVKSKNWKLVEQDIRAVTESVTLPVKVILETGLLSREEIQEACRCCEESGARFVKTSTGFSVGGATVENIALMKASLSERVLIKASGGIKSAQQAQALIAAGASRLGTSSGVQIVLGQSGDPKTY